MFVDVCEKGVECFFGSGFIPRLRFCGIKFQLTLIDCGAYPRLLSRRRRVLPLTSEKSCGMQRGVQSYSTLSVRLPAVGPTDAGDLVTAFFVTIFGE